MTELDKLITHEESLKKAMKNDEFLIAYLQEALNYKDIPAIVLACKHVVMAKGEDK